MFNELGNKPASQQRIQQSNIRLVFKHIYDNKGISRAKIASITKLSPTTISSLTEQLIKKKLIKEIGYKVVKNSGRRGILLDVNKSGAYFISTDLQESGYNIALYDLKCNLIKETYIELKKYNKLGKSIIENTTILLKQFKIKEDKLSGISIGAPGLIDVEDKTIVSSTIISITKENKFIDEIKKRFNNIKIELINESSLSAYAEKQFVKSIKLIENILYIDIHTGIGAGIIINGNIYRGYNNVAGEFGHISVDINGPICKCGARGCLETVANIKTIMKQLKKYSDIETIVKKYNEADKEVTKVINNNAKYIAYGINNAINLLNPEVVIIGGKIKIFGQKYLNRIIKTQQKIGLDKNKDIKITLSKVKGNPVTLGGAKYLLDTILIR